MKQFIVICLVCFLVACSENKKKNFLEKGWDAFTQGDYIKALSELQTAKIKKPNDPNIRTALGWTYIRMDSLESANREFNEGALLAAPPIDLAAGWAFVLAATHNYALSKVKAAQVLESDPNWFFEYASGIDHKDIRIVKAESHFLLGEFTFCLNEIVLLNPDFNADVSTVNGRTQLASEIERLRGLNKIQAFHN